MPAEPTSPDLAGRSIFGVVARAVPVLGLAVLIGWLVLPGGAPRGAEDAPDGAAALERAARCEGASLGYLVAHTADADWRVRAAAYAELPTHAPIEDIPLRDTPIDEREALMLDWLDRHEPGLVSDLCELFTQTNHLRFGRPLAGRCLTCHAGPEPTPPLADARCVACHETIYAQWAGTAHANSVSHLQLTGIEPATRRQVPFDFRGRKGMSCVACHQTTDDGTDGASRNGRDSTACVATFETLSCGDCHAQAQAQWLAWRDAPRYRRAVWPPGSVELSVEGPMSCVECHMPDGEHLWAARRDPELLRSGLVVSVAREADGRAVLTVRNLAGHNYPTGTTRRALHLYTQLDDEPERLTATLADSLPGTANPSITGPTLAPGETRRFTLPGRPTRVRARLVYARNRFQPDTYSVEVTAIEWSSTAGAIE